MLTAAERSRGRIRCRYRHGEVKPTSYFRVERSQEQIVGDMEADRQAARDGYNPNA